MVLLKSVVLHYTWVICLFIFGIFAVTASSWRIIFTYVDVLMFGEVCALWVCCELLNKIIELRLFGHRRCDIRIYCSTVVQKKKKKLFLSFRWKRNEKRLPERKLSWGPPSWSAAVAIKTKPEARASNGVTLGGEGGTGGGGPTIPSSGSPGRCQIMFDSWWFIRKIYKK